VTDERENQGDGVRDERDRARTTGVVAPRPVGVAARRSIRREIFWLESKLNRASNIGEGTMQLRHISPRSIDWMDAMDEGVGGHGWEKLAPEERIKLLRERRDEGSGYAYAQQAERANAQGFGIGSPSR
jgi:hypothetical protein